MNIKALGLGVQNARTLKQVIKLTTRWWTISLKPTWSHREHDVACKNKNKNSVPWSLKVVDTPAILQELTQGKSHNLKSLD